MYSRILVIILGLGLFASAKSLAQCSIGTFTLSPSLCLPAPNLGGYEVSGTIVATSPPTSGSLVIRTTFLFGGTTMYTIPLPAGTTYNFTIPAQTGNGGNITLYAYYTNNILCVKSTSYTAPRCCDVNAPSPVTVCESQTLTLNASTTTGGNFIWSGPNSFSSTQQNPVITNVATSRAGSYQVYLVNGSCTTSSVTVNVNVNTKPVSKNIKHW